MKARDRDMRTYYSVTGFIFLVLAGLCLIRGMHDYVFYFLILSAIYLVLFSIKEQNVNLTIEKTSIESDEMRAKLEKIFDHYGEEHQLDKLLEEIDELSIEAENASIGFEIDKDFLSEVADVLVVCSQFAIKYPEIYEIFEYKIDRQIVRMGAE